MTYAGISPAWYQQRKHELDWLRVMAFILLILYHLGMAYVTDWGWHIKSEHQSEWLKSIMLWSNQWRMLLLFFISGAAVSYQLRRNSGWGFIIAAGRKLFLPLLFGSLVIVAPQAFVELKIQDKIAEMSYLEFWRHYLGYPFSFGDALPPGYGRLEPTNITWNHLWYLAYLLAYVVVLWIFYPLLRKLARTRFMKLFILRGHSSLLFILPITLLYGIGVFLSERFPTTYLLVNDWHNNARYFTVFFFGFLLVRSHRWWHSIRNGRHFSLSLAVTSYAGVLFYSKGGEMSAYLALLQPFEALLQRLVWSANGWLWLLAILGFSQAWLNQPSHYIRKSNHGVYCYYMVHQTLIVVALYCVGRYALGPFLEPLALLAITASGCGLMYVFVRRIPGLRGLMGVTVTSDERVSTVWVSTPKA